MFGEYFWSPILLEYMFGKANEVTIYDDAQKYI